MITVVIPVEGIRPGDVLLHPAFANGAEVDYVEETPRGLTEFRIRVVEGDQFSLYRNSGDDVGVLFHNDGQRVSR